jgi:hypothetical protein
MRDLPPLLTPSRFVDAIDRLAERRTASPSEISLEASGVSLATIHHDRRTFAKLLVRDLQANRIDPAPGRMYWIEKKGKRRRLFDFPLVESIIHDAVARWLAERMSPDLSAHLYSYQPGVSYHRALRAFAGYVRAANAKRFGANTSGVCVLRRDVHQYFDSIPVHDEAPLWPLLRTVLERTDSQVMAWPLVLRTIRPLLKDGSGRTYTLDRGIPTGSPVANVIANLYLSAMDNDISRVEGVFYARYGDDLIAAHADVPAAAAVADRLAVHLGSAGLDFNAEKTRDAYLTRSGGVRQASFAPATHVELLGHRVGATGTISLSVKKTRRLLEDLQLRAENAACAVEGDVERIASAIRAVNRLINPRSSAAHPYAKLLATTVTDRSYLKWLDHELRLIVLAAAAATRSPRHFRGHSPRELRSGLGLRSLVVMRNRVGRRQ